MPPYWGQDGRGHMERKVLKILDPNFLSVGEVGWLGRPLTKGE